MSKYLYLKYQDWDTLEGEDVRIPGIKAADVASVTVSGSLVKLWIITLDKDQFEPDYDEVLSRFNTDFQEALGPRNYVIGVKYA